MVYDGTIERQSPLSFTITPPNIHNLNRTRFRDPRNSIKMLQVLWPLCIIGGWPFYNAKPLTNAHAFKAARGDFTKILGMCLPMTSCFGGEVINCCLQIRTK